MTNHEKSKRHYRFTVFLFLFTAFQSHAQIQVWPGDANNDGIVNNLDILNLGIGFGRQGNPRDSVSTIWKQEQVQPWSGALPSGLNLGFTDCSGNGFVTVDDIVAIEDNYNATNSNFTGLNFLIGDPDDPVIDVISNGSAFHQGQQASVTVHIEQQESDSIYGIAFSFDYDTTIIREATVAARIHPTFGGGGRQPVSVQKNDTLMGNLEYGVSRTNGINHGGSIAVCIIDFVIEDNLIGKTFLDFTDAFCIKNVRLYDRQMNDIPVRGDTADARIMSGIRDEQPLQFNIYPVPASDWLFIDNYKNKKLVSVEMIDLKGTVYLPVKVEHDRSLMLDVAAVPQGIYVLRLVTEDGVMYRKMIINR